MVNVTITVDGRICYKFTETPQAVTNLNCTTPLTGRFINVSKSGPIDKLQVHTLNICEVEVWGKYIIFKILFQLIVLKG